MLEFPRISIVTPSFNQAVFLERTIQSVLRQGYPNLEYIIIDGGSTDGSVDIIRKYSNKLAWWISEPDKGQTNAINKGLRRATGEWVGWQNSDDIYFPNTLQNLAAAIIKSPKAGLIVADMMLIDENDQPLRDIRYVKPTYNALIAEGMLLANQAAFWRRHLHEEIGFLLEDMHYAFDYEWFLRLTKHTKSIHVCKVWGGLRLHRGSKTSTQSQCFKEENQRVLLGREMPASIKLFYKLRRMVLMVRRGQLGYVIRGIFNRMSQYHGGRC